MLKFVTWLQVWFQNRLSRLVFNNQCILNFMYRRARENVKAGRVSLTAKAASSADKPKENDDGTLRDVAETEGIQTKFPWRDETPEEPKAVTNNPPSHTSELFIIADSAVFNWASNEANEPPNSTTSCKSLGPPTVSICTALPNTRMSSGLDLGLENLYSLHLPASYNTQLSQYIHPLDLLACQCSFDTSLQRLPFHPHTNLARVKNSALYGASVGVSSSNPTSYEIPTAGVDGSPHSRLMNNCYHGAHKLQCCFASPSARSATARHDSSPSTTHFSNLLDSWASRMSSVQRIRYTGSLSPSPLSTYSTTGESDPLPARLTGPPMPGFQFGASSSVPFTASPNSIDSERDSPDLMRFSFDGGEENQPSLPYHIPRFSSAPSVATSKSSVNSAYYGGSTIVCTDRQNSTGY